MVSKKQTAAGCADAINHVMEQYITGDTTLLNDGFCGAALKSLMVSAVKCPENAEDYTARAEMMPASATAFTPSETALPAGSAAASNTR